MGTVLRRLRRHVKPRVAFDFETAPLVGCGKTRITMDPLYQYREDLEGQWRQGQGLVFLDESHDIRREALSRLMALEAQRAYARREHDRFVATLGDHFHGDKS